MHLGLHGTTVVEGGQLSRKWRSRQNDRRLLQYARLTLVDAPRTSHQCKKGLDLGRKRDQEVQTKFHKDTIAAELVYLRQKETARPKQKDLEAEPKSHVRSSAQRLLYISCKLHHIHACTRICFVHRSDTLHCIPASSCSIQ